MKLSKFSLFFLSAILICSLADSVHAWSDPILVTPDTAMSRDSRCVIDEEGNIHFFFLNNRYQEIPAELRYDVYHCKFSPDGVRLTDDLRLDTTYSAPAFNPSPVLGVDGKLHVAWMDEVVPPWQYQEGIYYARLDVDGHIERPATKIFDGPGTDPAFLFQDSEGNLSVVWVVEYDTLFYGKFDTTGQVLIPQLPVYIPAPNCNLWYMEACMDGLNQVHCVYKHYYGLWSERNLGYSRVNNDGQVLVEYAPLTPENPDSNCSKGYITADGDDYLHVIFVQQEYGEKYQYYRKMDRDLNTIYEYRVCQEALAGSDVGYGDITINIFGNIVIAFAYNRYGIALDYRRVTYSTEGVELIPPESILGEDLVGLPPDLVTGPRGFVVFNYSGGPDSLTTSKVWYCYEVDHPMFVNDTQVQVPEKFHVSAHPNPFNPVTMLSYNLPEQSKVILKVYNLHGRLVATLVDGWRDEGLHEVTFDASSLISGVYFYRIEAEGFTATRKIVLMK